MNRIPAIKSDVPIGKRINGDEMLSFMARPLGGWRTFAGARTCERWRAFPSPHQAVGRTKGIRARLLAGRILIPGVVAIRNAGRVIRPSSYPRFRPRTVCGPRPALDAEIAV